MSGDGFLCCDPWDSGPCGTISCSTPFECRGGKLKLLTREPYAVLKEVRSSSDLFKLCLLSKIDLGCKAWDVRIVGDKVYVAGKCGCLFVVSLLGKIVTKLCFSDKEFRGVDVSPSRALAIDWGGEVWDFEGNVVFKGPKAFSITITSDGIILCGPSACYYVEDGEVVWRARGWFEGRVVRVKDLIVVPSVSGSLLLFDAKSGVMVRTIDGWEGFGTWTLAASWWRSQERTRLACSKRRMALN